MITNEELAEWCKRAAAVLIGHGNDDMRHGLIMAAQRLLDTSEDTERLDKIQRYELRLTKGVAYTAEGAKDSWSCWDERKTYKYAETAREAIDNA